ncbi:PREDICTED: RING finger protein 37-like [Branchiostoma belcheri]|uniref:RING finger protein 37-like n=1 Tax=Branchiostoma belcheri TaxID=7741 RepID=A0A6P4YAZ6_BRABE|nr:PREDICTED: RING finger protein 37-like [Branchiostoma belcheri]
MDLCHPALHPRIHCDKVSADGYDVTNLVSADPRVRARGFRAEYFIKPPVNVILSFPFHIHIQRIDVDPCVGSNVSLGLQILTHSAASVENWLVDSKQSSTSASLNSALNPDTFNLVGKAFLEERRFLCFKNNRYSPRHPFVGKEFLPGALDCNVYETNLWQKSLASLNRVSHLMVRIVRTQSASIPVLRSVRVYGQPSASCNKEVISLVHQISKSLKQPPPVEPAATSVQSPPCKEEEVQDVSRNLQQESSKDNPSIPLEFLDEITLELMALPMMLPSGHSVDQSTLDKHSQSEEVWGRPPSDPFTGVPYTRNSYPVPNTALKVRIDKFLLQEGKHLTNVGRTVGRRTRSAAQASATTSQTISHSRTIQQAPSTSKALHSSAQQASQGRINMSNSASASNHAPKVSELHVNTFLCAQDPSGQSENLAKRCTEGSELEPCRKRPKVTGEQPYSGSHEEALSQSLDAALARTLGSIPTFKRRIKEPAISQVAASSLVKEDNNELHANRGVFAVTYPWQYDINSWAKWEQLLQVQLTSCTELLQPSTAAVSAPDVSQVPDAGARGEDADLYTVC